MNYGRFFELDLDSSRIEGGVSVFNYIDLSDAFSKKEKQMTPEYPIFVTVTSSSVKFILQYCVYKYDNKISRYYPSERNNEFSLIHLEQVILELPLKMTSGQSLSSIVKRIYSTPFPVQAKGDNVNYIEELIKSRYDKIGGGKLHYEVRQHDILKERDKRIICYSSLYVWGLYENGKYELFDKSDNNKCNKFLRKIFLDFLFDMVHSDVFKNSVHFDAVYSALLSDYFCASIIKKSEFYYQRAIINEQYNEERKEVNVVAKEIYATYFDNAEAEWLECIQAKEADKEFENTRQWYKSKKALPSIRGQYNEVLFPSFNRHSSSWFVAPEIELRRVYFNNLEDENNPDKGKICCSNDFSELLGKDNGNAEDLQKRRHRSSVWLFRRYDFADAFRLATGKRGVNTFLMLLMLFLSIIMLSPRTFECLMPFVLKNLHHVVIISLLILVMVLFLRSCKKLGMFKAKTLYYKVCALHRNLHFLFPRLIASITAAWLTVAFSEDLYKAFFDSPWSGWSIGIIVSLILLFVYYEVDKIVPRVGVFVKLFRSSQLLLTSFVISLVVGIIVINFTGERILIRSGILPEFYRDNVLLDKNRADDKLVISLDKNSIAEKDYISLIHSYTYGLPIKPTPIKQEEVKESGESIITWVMPDKPSREDTLAQINAFMEIFAKTDYEREYTARIKEAKDSVAKMETFEHIKSDSLLLGQFLIRHEDSRMFKDLLEKVSHVDNNQKVATFINIGNNGYKFFILYDFLIQFAVVAMFIGIFIQMIFEEKNITEL